MEIRERHSLFALFIESFRLVNRSAGVIAAYIFAAVLGALFQIVLVWIGAGQMLISLFNALYSLYLGVVLWRLLAAKAENNGESFSNSLSASLFPTLYMLPLSLFFGVLFALVFFIFFFTHSVWFAGAALAVLALALAPRLMFAPFIIALREQGPVAALVYSWRLGGQYYFTVLASLLIFFLFPLLFSAAVFYGLYAGIPLYFADSFNLAALTPVWYAVFIFLAVLQMFVFFSMTAFTLLVFLNLDYGENRASFPAAGTPAPQEPLFAADPRTAQEPSLISAEEVRAVEVTKSSVRTEADSAQLEQHLEQVYQPKPEDLVQYTQEEDRMPTILFDDEMARQIEQNRQMWQQQTQTPSEKKEEDEGSSIKMSK